MDAETSIAATCLFEIRELEEEFKIKNPDHKM